MGQAVEWGKSFEKLERGLWNMKTEIGGIRVLIWRNQKVCEKGTKKCPAPINRTCTVDVSYSVLADALGVSNIRCS